MKKSRLEIMRNSAVLRDNKPPPSWIVEAWKQHEKHMSFLTDYYGVDRDAISEMCLSLDNMSYGEFYELTLAGYEYEDGQLTAPPKTDINKLGLEL